MISDMIDDEIKQTLNVSSFVKKGSNILKQLFFHLGFDLR